MLSFLQCVTSVLLLIDMSYARKYRFALYFRVLDDQYEWARANSYKHNTFTITGNDFTIPESYEKVDSYKERKNNNYNTEKLL